MAFFWPYYETDKPYTRPIEISVQVETEVEVDYASPVESTHGEELLTGRCLLLDIIPTMLNGAPRSRSHLRQRLPRAAAPVERPNHVPTESRLRPSQGLPQPMPQYHARETPENGRGVSRWSSCRLSVAAL